MKTLGDLMTADVLAVAPEDTLGETATKMVERGVGSVVVSDYGRLIGILTERDMLRAMADRTHPSLARVREWMPSDPVTATTDMDPAAAAKVMLERNFRHLPVVEEGRAIGIVSIRDVVQWISERAEQG